MFSICVLLNTPNAQCLKLKSELFVQVCEGALELQKQT